MNSLVLDLLKAVFVDPFFDYFVHDITLGRIITRVLAAIALTAGVYLAFFQSAPLSYVGLMLIAPAGFFVAYDTLTVNRHTRR